jgi:hypothetical protein
MAMSAHSKWLDQFEEGNATGGHAGGVEAIPYPAVSLSMTSRRFPPLWRADKMPGGYVVRDANGQALADAYPRQDPTEAIQAKTLTADEGRRLTKVQRLTKVGRRWDGHRRQVNHG